MKNALRISLPVLISILAFGAAAPSVFAASPGDVIINEFSSDGISSSDWIELQNTTGADISLSGWKLTDLTFGGQTATMAHIGGTATTTIGAVTIPAYGLVVIVPTTGGFNQEGDMMTLYDASGVQIHAVSYGSISFGGGEHVTGAPSSTSESAYRSVPSSWTIGTPTKGWFNDAGQQDKAPLLSTIDSNLHDAEVETNMGELANPSATPATEGAGALYFEKTGRGKIVFEKELNLTSTSTVAVLQSLGTAMEMSAGHIKFDSTTAADMNATGAKIYMYGLDALGFTSQPSIIVKNDGGTVIDGSGIVNSIAYSAGGSNSGQLSFSASHFTQFDLPTKVSGITVTSAGDATTISTNGGTLQMSATVLPAEATDKTVTWSITSGTDFGTINGSGLLTAVANGTVTVKALANDGSTIFGTKDITISGQVAPSADTVYVNALRPNDDGTIQAAINAANSGDTINVSAGTYTEQITITKSLDLIGAGETTTTILAPAIRTGSVARSTNRGAETNDYVVAAYALSSTIDVRIQGFTIDANGKNKTSGTTRFDGVFFGDVLDAGGTTAGLFSSTIQNFGSATDNSGIMVEGNSTLTVDDNAISNYTSFGIDADGDNGSAADPNVTIHDNVLTGSNAGYGILAFGGGIETIKGNDISGNTRTSPTGYGILISNSNNVIIGGSGSGDANQIHDNFIGIELDVANNTTIANNTLTHNVDRAIQLSDADSNTVSGNTINGPTNGADVTGIGLSNGSNLNTIGGNTSADGNTITMATSGTGLLYAIYMQSDVGTGSNTIKYNTIAGGQRAIQFDGPPGITGLTTIANNTISNQTFGGITAYNNGNLTITDNTLTNTVRPMEFFGPHDLTITGNTIDGSTYAGINLGNFSGTADVGLNTIHGIGTGNNGVLAQAGGTSLSIHGNTIYDVSERGIQINTAATNANIDGNEIYDVNGYAGIVIDGGATGVKINNNYIHDNHSGGVSANVQTAEFNNNRVLSNDFGVEVGATGATFVLQDNKITGNDSAGTACTSPKYGVCNSDLSVYAGSANAANNWWGSSVLATVAAKITSGVTFKPYYIDEAKTTLSNIKAITAFSFATPAASGVINETAHTIAVNVPHGTDVTTLVPTISITGASISPTSGSTKDFTATSTYTVTVANSTTQAYAVKVTVLEETQKAPDASGDATIDSTTPEVVITNPTQAVDVTISSGTTNPTIDVSAFITGGTGTLPAITITSANANNTDVEIPASTIVTSASTTWNGVIAAPTVTTVDLPVTSGQTKTFSTAIEVGFSGEKLSFSKAVRILLVGQAGKRAGYVRTGTAFTEITNTCSADTQVAGDALDADSECKIDAANGSDLVIWTKHFTTFATYTQTTNSTGGGGGGCGDGFVWNTATTSCIPRTVTTTGSPTLNQGQVLGAATYNFTKNLSVGSKNSDVTALQQLLIDSGYAISAGATGNFGAQTRAAVIAFQKAHHIVQTGTVGSLTRAELNKGIIATTPETSSKSNLTTSQVNSIITVLQSFGVDQAIIDKVRTALGE
ncbi:MAG: right-handed parallel beta-helix repeat-containing protein [Candidatus Kaiserbacteria bacterium]|nr:right-handed parallel beta-helix repeat-containing protein [Candidatus Kaiserbacteria bacterium]